MSNKIRLTNTGQKFELVGIGYMKDETRNTVQFRFSSGLGIGSVEAAFADVSAIEKGIEYVLPDETVKEVITDCVAYQSISKDNEGKYLVTLSTDKVSAEIKRTKDELTAAKLELEAAKEQILAANSMINALSDAIVLISVPAI